MGSARIRKTPFWKGDPPNGRSDHSNASRVLRFDTEPVVDDRLSDKTNHGLLQVFSAGVRALAVKYINNLEKTADPRSWEEKMQEKPQKLIFYV